jgi:phosphate acetyltransferase
MSAVSVIKEKAKQLGRRVVLPEGTEPRMIEATKKILEQGIASITLLGDINEINRLADQHELDVSQVEITDPERSDAFDSFVDDFMAMRKAKGITRERAVKTMKQPLYYGAMLVRNGKADASVAGSVNTTGDVLRAAIHVIGLKQGINTVSSFFMMTVPRYRDTENKVFLYADGAVVPNPTSEQLASIAASTAESMRNLVGEEPRVAFLSFSTRGSASHPDVSKVVKAVEIFKENHPDIRADGELQVDAAIVPEICKRKAPDSPITGDANVLIFPDLDAGNIAYKLTQRLANATATGPIIQGLAQPANDLSRGCSAEDIVDVCAIALVMKG